MANVSQHVLIVGLKHPLEELLHRFPPSSHISWRSWLADQLLQVGMAEDSGPGDEVEPGARAHQGASLQDHSSFNLQYAEVTKSLLLGQAADGLQDALIIQRLTCMGTRHVAPLFMTNVAPPRPAWR